MPQASAQRKFSDAITYMKVIDIFHSYIDGFRKPYIETADVGQFSNIETYRATGLKVEKKYGRSI